MAKAERTALPSEVGPGANAKGVAEAVDGAKAAA
jgi:hypothetical protein